MPRAWRWAWSLLGVPLALLFGLGILWLLRPATYPYRDLTQDWLSARCYFDGRSIYTPHGDSAPPYFGRDVENWTVKINAHPPVSVLALLPLGLLDHKQALLYWNIASLVMMAIAIWVVLGPWGLNCDAWYWLAATCLVVTSFALAGQVKYSQFNALLALVLALAWVADRRGQSAWAGALVGFAAGFKLFPAYLLLYFFCLRRWRALVWALAIIAGLHLAAVGVFGWRDVVHYFREVVPQVNWWKSNWSNWSLTGYWFRLFNVTDGATQELVHLPWLAKGLTLACSAAVTALMAWKCWRARTIGQRDVAFAVAVFGMLLVSPITWDHYMLILLAPFAVLWFYLAVTWRSQLLLAVLAFPLGWLPTYQLWIRFFTRTSETITGFSVAEPWHTFTVLALFNYCLFVLFVWAIVGQANVRQAGQSAGSFPGGENNDRRG